MNPWLPVALAASAFLLAACSGRDEKQGSAPASNDRAGETVATVSAAGGPSGRVQLGDATDCLAA
jgi:hypothetical protein